MFRTLISLVVALLACPSAHADLRACFEHAAQRRHINVKLLLAIGHVESRYRPAEVNTRTGAMGLMQVMPFHLNWLRRYGIDRRDLFDGCTNINVGAFLLSDFIRMYGNTWRAVGAYGAGIAPDKERARIEYARLVQREYLRLANAGSEPAPRAARIEVQPGLQRPTMVVDR
ncbi:Lytic transglycosylase (plasmid) [Paraburkholderia kururiensis]|uniref:lytic transglycosylase domain-containing protein n=1 Tax=Paraburkholderia kururiensis TaxID=984307 RepID=UPI0039A5816D